MAPRSAGSPSVLVWLTAFLMTALTASFRSPAGRVSISRRPWDLYTTNTARRRPFAGFRAAKPVILHAQAAGRGRSSDVREAFGVGNNGVEKRRPVEPMSGRRRPQGRQGRSHADLRTILVDGEVQPKLLNSYLKRCRHYNELKDLVLMYCDHFNMIHVSSTFSQLGKVRGCPPGHRLQHQAMYTRLLERVEAIQHTADTRFYANVLWFFGKRMVPLPGFIVRYFSDLHDMDDFDGPNIGSSAWACAKLGVAFPTCLKRTLHLNTTKVAGFAPQEVSNTLWAIATLRATPDRKHVFATPPEGDPFDDTALPEPLQHAMGPAVRAHCNDFKPQELANCAWAFGILYSGQDASSSPAASLAGTSHRPSVVDATAEGEAEADAVRRFPASLTSTLDNRPTMDDFTTQGIANVAHAYSKLGYRDFPAPMLRTLDRRHRDGVDATDFSGQELSITLLSFAQMGKRPHKALVNTFSREHMHDRNKALYTTMNSNQHGFQELSVVALALANLGVMLPSSIVKIFWALKADQYQSFSSHDLAMSIWAFASIYIRRSYDFEPEMVRGEPVTDMIWTRADSEEDCGPTLNKLMVPEGLYRAFLERESFSDFNNQDLSMSVWAMANLNLEIPANLKAAIMALPTPTFDVDSPPAIQAISNIAWAAYVLQEDKLLMHMLEATDSMPAELRLSGVVGSQWHLVGTYYEHVLAPKLRAAGSTVVIPEWIKSLKTFANSEPLTTRHQLEAGNFVAELGFEYEAEASVHGYIVDLLISLPAEGGAPAMKLVLEVDGEHHYDYATGDLRLQDRRRGEVLSALGYTVRRIRNAGLSKEAVASAIASAKAEVAGA